MPSPATTRRPSKRHGDKAPPAKTKTIDVGVPLGIYDTNSVRDRVRKWQSQGGGVITAPDIYVEDDEGDEKDLSDSQLHEQARKKPSTPKPKNVHLGEPTSDRSKSRRGARSGDARQDRNRSRSAPPKRVVSDAHWRTVRSPPRSPSSSKKVGDLPKSKLPPDDGIRVKPILGTQGRRKQRGQDDRTLLERENVEFDDGIRVFPTPPGSSKRSRNLENPQQEDAKSYAEGISDAEVKSSKSPCSLDADSSKRNKHTAAEESSCLESSAAKAESRRRRSSHAKEEINDAEHHAVAKGFSEGRGSTKSQRGNILSQVFGDTRKIFSKQQPMATSAPRVPSIEAWLKETSDPFIDGKESSPSEVAPLGSKSEATDEDARIKSVKDPNKIWDSVGPNGPKMARHGSKRRKRESSSAIYEDLPAPTGYDSDVAVNASPKGASPAPKLCDLVQGSPEPSPTSLKRRGAKKSLRSPSRARQKSELGGEPVAHNDHHSVLSSIETASSVEAPDSKTPLRPPGLAFKRPFPSTGQHRLSTIASVETFDTRVRNAAPSSLSEISTTMARPQPHFENGADEETRDSFDPNSLRRSKSRLTKHADLISILSLPKAGNRSIQSARSIRTNRSRLATATIGDLLKELAMDETKYMRELRTLVDGVIPVLLTCVLSKSDSAVAAGLFRPSANFNEDPNFTRPIIDMGIALERLKSLHKRIPMQDVNGLLSWAQGAQRVYAEYLKAWRMGFQDVVVNLAPATEASPPDPSSLPSDQDGLDGGLPRNEDGDVVDGDGERVDVAFLLKRPLVRLKYLAKTLKGINFLIPSTEAETLATKYQNLVIDARNRSNEERARLEDEAAISIDVTRARDIRTLAPLTGVSIDKTRHVRARDHFNLVLQHSSGQRIDSRVELLLRDEDNGMGSGGDLLICEVESKGRWLLFPPVQSSYVSARNGDLKAEIVVMLRGLSRNGTEWQELLALRTDDEQVGFEWVQMLGLTPVPPKISRSHSFLNTRPKKQGRSESVFSAQKCPINSATMGKSRTPSPREVEIPIGEKTSSTSRTWVENQLADPTHASDLGLLRNGARLQKESPPTTPPKPSKDFVGGVNDLRSLPSQISQLHVVSHEDQTAGEINVATESHKSNSPAPLRRARAKRISKHGGCSPISSRTIESHDEGQEMPNSRDDMGEASPTQKNVSSSPDDLRSVSPDFSLSCKSSSQKVTTDHRPGSPRPASQRSRASVPSMELPTIPKVRKNSLPKTPISEPEEELDWPLPDKPDSSPLAKKLTKKRLTPLKTASEHTSLPSTPQHNSPTLKGSKTPVLLANSYQTTKRRSSSPLKHEYEPSTSSDSPSDSETSTVEHNEVSSISDSSDDDELESGYAPTPLVPLGTFQSSPKASAPGSIYSLPNGTLSPSQSASQAPYKTVPSQPAKASKTIASIFAWSDKGAWESLHPEECSIVISPGLIEAYKMSAAHSGILRPRSSVPVTDVDAFSDLSSDVAFSCKEPEGERPLVALELTPLVPLRRGTALDISIRSPPTANSQITSGDNIMFRSRNAEECEALYALINHSRINNPTYVALQNARGPYGSGYSFASSLDRRNSSRVGSHTSSWFGGLGRSPSYRAKSAPTPSIAPSDSSIGSMMSVFSALKRYGKGGMFNIARSTISSRNGSRTNSIYTGSDNSNDSGTNSSIAPGAEGTGKPAAIGLSNAKIRLYIRESASKWRDLGSARLSIMPPTGPLQSPEGGPENVRAHPSQASEKRIVIHGKTKGEVLLDVQLGERCFERTARTGIAVNVWEDAVGPNGEVGVVGAIGGVGAGTSKVYMIQVSRHSVTLGAK